jgi:hypothetical protein
MEDDREGQSRQKRQKTTDPDDGKKLFYPWRMDAKTYSAQWWREPLLQYLSPDHKDPASGTYAFEELLGCFLNDTSSDTPKFSEKILYLLQDYDKFRESTLRRPLRISVGCVPGSDIGPGQHAPGYNNFRRFMSNLPRNLKHVDLTLGCARAYESLPSHVDNLTSLKITKPYDVDGVNGVNDANLHAMLFFAQKVSILHLENFDSEMLLPADRSTTYESKCTTLRLTDCSFVAGPVLHDEITMPYLEFLSIEYCPFCSREIWANFFQKTHSTLKRLRLDVDENFPVQNPFSITLFGCMCLEATDPDRPLSNLEALELSTKSADLLPLEFLARDPAIRRNLKSLKIANFLIDLNMLPTFNKFEALSDLTVHGKLDIDDLESDYYNLFLRGVFEENDRLKRLSIRDIVLSPDTIEALPIRSLEHLQLLNTGCFDTNSWASLEMLDMIQTNPPSLSLRSLCIGEDKEIPKAVILRLSKRFPSLERLDIINTNSSSTTMDITTHFLSSQDVQDLQKYALGNAKLLHYEMSFPWYGEEHAEHTRKLQCQIRIHCFMNRVRKSYHPTDRTDADEQHHYYPAPPTRGVLPLIIQECDHYAGPSGVFRLLQDKVFGEMGLR